MPTAGHFSSVQGLLSALSSTSIPYTLTLSHKQQLAWARSHPAFTAGLSEHGFTPSFP